jgi:hypothetical protein
LSQRTRGAMIGRTMSLRTQLDALASKFAADILAVVHGSSLQELVAVQGGGSGVGNGRRARPAGGGGHPNPLATTKAKTGKGGRLARRSSDDIAAALGNVVALVKKHKDGLRAEEIRANLGLQSKELPRVLKEGLAKKQLAKKGQKRATVYFAK